VSARLTAVVGVWLLACVAGLGLLWRYKTRPGPAGDPPRQWPASSGLAVDPGRPTLVMLAHPRCACTRASLDELNQVMNRVHDVTAYVVFVVPPGVSRGWEHGASWDQAARIPGVVPVADVGGVEAARFRVLVSGHTLLYDRDGRLRFSGGLTGSRGHVGDNVGRRRVLDLLTSGSADRAASNVYGCALSGPQ
jgi:hypothetical protein